LRIAKDWLNERGSIFVRCDYNGNWIVRCLMDEIFGRENFRNEIDIKRNQSLPKTGDVNLVEETENLFVYSVTNGFVFKNMLVEREKPYWGDLGTRPSDKKNNPSRFVNGIEFKPPEYRRWSYSQENLDEMYKNGRLKIEDGKLKILIDKTRIGSNWTDITGYSSTPTWGFSTENAEKLLFRVLDTSSNKNDLVLDFFLGSGTTTAVAHKLGRKWIGIEMGEHFYTVVLPRMKKVLAYDKSGISKENDVKEYYNEKNAGGFFKYYELEQYEETLANTVYENHDLFLIGNKSPYEQYVFLKDEKMLKALEIDYENNKIKVDLSKLYENIDIAETLSNLTGKWIKKITDGEVEFEDGTKINTEDLDYKLIKPLIWWE
jgi:adenine specific DNA methylase Mod